MYNYAILANPGHNRIYFDTAITIACSEIEAILSGIDIELVDIGVREIGLPSSICFATHNPLPPEAIQALCSSSIYYVLFERQADGWFKPITPAPLFTFPESMTQILRYTGKTNEQFTRLMVNLALSACKTQAKQKQGQITLIDPMCGKGTTLYEGWVRGFNVAGIEINDKWALEINNYVTKFLKQGRFKHKARKEKRNLSNGKKLCDCYIFDAAATKEAFAAKQTQSFHLYPADTRQANLLLKKKSCDIMVSDLPYGVQHGSKQGAQEGKMDRSPLTLLEDAIPAWKPALKQHGAVVLSFNEFTLKWREVADLFSRNGFDVLDTPSFTGYLHRVDQSIKRNLLVAVKR